MKLAMISWLRNRWISQLFFLRLDHTDRGRIVSLARETDETLMDSWRKWAHFADIELKLFFSGGDCGEICSSPVCASISSHGNRTAKSRGETWKWRRKKNAMTEEDEWKWISAWQNPAKTGTTRHIISLSTTAMINRNGFHHSWI